MKSFAPFRCGSSGPLQIPSLCFPPPPHPLFVPPPPGKPQRFGAGLSHPRSAGGHLQQNPHIPLLRGKLTEKKHAQNPKQQNFGLVRTRPRRGGMELGVRFSSSFFSSSTLCPEHRGCNLGLALGTSSVGEAFVKDCSLSTVTNEARARYSV